MKLPQAEALTKATVEDPIIASHTSQASNASIAGNTGKTSNAGKAKSETTKFTIRLDRELMGRIRSAYLAQYQAGAKAQSLSKWAAQILADAVEEIEQNTNNGNQFTPLPAGNVPRLPLL